MTQTHLQLSDNAVKFLNKFSYLLEDESFFRFIENTIDEHYLPFRTLTELQNDVTQQKDVYFLELREDTNAQAQINMLKCVLSDVITTLKDNNTNYNIQNLYWKHINTLR